MLNMPQSALCALCMDEIERIMKQQLRKVERKYFSHIEENETTFIIAGVGADKEMKAVIFSTNLSRNINVSEGEVIVSFIPPSDVEMEKCTEIAAHIMNENRYKLTVHNMAIEIVRNIANLSAVVNKDVLIWAYDNDTKRSIIEAHEYIK